MPGDAARVDTRDGGDAVALEPSGEGLGGPPARGLRDIGPHHETPCYGRRGLDILIVGTHISDVRKGEGDDLAGIGWVGQNLLVAGHGGVKHELADVESGLA